MSNWNEISSTTKVASRERDNEFFFKFACKIFTAVKTLKCATEEQIDGKSLSGKGWKLNLQGEKSVFADNRKMTNNLILEIIETQNQKGHLIRLTLECREANSVVCSCEARDLISGANGNEPSRTASDSEATEWVFAVNSRNDVANILAEFGFAAKRESLDNSTTFFIFGDEPIILVREWV